MRRKVESCQNSSKVFVFAPWVLESLDPTKVAYNGVVAYYM